MLVSKTKYILAERQVRNLQDHIQTLRHFHEREVEQLRAQIRVLERLLDKQDKQPIPMADLKLVIEEEETPEGTLGTVQSLHQRLEEIYGDGLPIEEIERRRSAYQEAERRKAEAEYEQITKELEALHALG